MEAEEGLAQHCRGARDGELGPHGPGRSWPAEWMPSARYRGPQSVTAAAASATQRRRSPIAADAGAPGVGLTAREADQASRAVRAVLAGNVYML